MASDTQAPELPVASPFSEGSYELVSKSKFSAFQILSSSPTADPIFYVHINESLKNKFDVLLHKGDSKSGETLGVAKRHTTGYTVGLGDPAGEIEGQQMIWEKLERPEKHNLKVWCFGFGTGEQRKTYTFRKTNGRSGRLKIMELRIGGADEENGDLLAKWVGSSRWNTKKGSLFVSNAVNTIRGDPGEQQERHSDLEIMICLATFAIIENQVRM